ncbi:protein phosphatase [Filifactor alocis]|nr:protein phosphatase [Filifactor alocis]
MNTEMNTGELLVEQTKENQTRLILEIVKESKDKEEAIEKIKALLNK